MLEALRRLLDFLIIFLRNKKKWHYGEEGEMPPKTLDDAGSYQEADNRAGRVHRSKHSYGYCKFGWWKRVP